MPTGRCEDQVRHSVARAPVVGMVVLFALGGLIVMASHSFAVTVAVVIVGLVALGAVVMMWHRHGFEHQRLQIESPRPRQYVTATRVTAPAPQVVEHHHHYLPAPQPAAVTEIHNHLHIHGVLSGEQQRQLAQITAGQSPTAIDEN